ncbi:hypothetical protein BO78DRAFT_159968 [Aspergillus sclerotiicarbonarius CBS 121057]|uniref:Uncharacterized protein n=1 Tax=Aspergillus sclerotiicarbonarius (strain CBS 121057 / IBT 28362) TaxID=1448318 RepID=A0A319E4E3_ASPSB|nr:hypothetical protein BO78DRAFT_159968 [Aspergillus sclerotiicarbonarius CBS 121057]
MTSWKAFVHHTIPLVFLPFLFPFHAVFRRIYLEEPERLRFLYQDIGACTPCIPFLCILLLTYHLPLHICLNVLCLSLLFLEISPSHGCRCHTHILDLSWKRCRARLVPGSGTRNDCW